MKNYVFLLLTIFALFTSCNTYDTLQDIEHVDHADQGQSDDAEAGSLTLYEVNGNTISKIKDYEVKRRLIPFQEDRLRHQQIWELFIELVPLSARNKITEFIVFHGGGDLGGYVHPINDNDLSKWRFGIAIDLEGDLSKLDFADEFTYVTLHEYGHVLTLNNNQVNVGDNSHCPSFYTGEGCSNSNSYINKLFDLGWADIYKHHNEEDPYETYEQYRDRFQTEYAATNPGEDVAEVFAYFIMLEDEPVGNTIAEQKVKLMYSFPELVTLRNSIRSKVSPETLRRALKKSSTYHLSKKCRHKHHRAALSKAVHN